MVTGEQYAVMLAVTLDVTIAEEFGDLEGLDVDLVDALLHRHRVDLVRRIRQVTGGRRETSVKIRRPVVIHRLHHADLLLRVNRVRSDEELIRLLVNQTVRRRAANRDILVDHPRKVGLHLVKEIRRFVRHVRRIGNRPERTRPRHDRARATLTFAIEGVKLRIDARNKRRSQENSSNRIHASILAILGQIPNTQKCKNPAFGGTNRTTDVGQSRTWASPA